MQAKSNNCEYPLVSVCSCVKNSVGPIKRSIESVLAQDYPNIEFVVQDGASTDGTLEILKSYGDRISLVSEPDSGPGDGFFRALSRVRGEFFGSCLADEELLPHAVSWAVENLMKYPEVAAIYGDHYITDIDGNITTKHIPKLWDFEKFLCSEFTPPFCTSFFRRSSYEAIDLREYTGCGEFDLWIRLGAKFPIRHVTGLVAKYAVHPGELSRQANLKADMMAARKIAIERLCSNPETPESIRLLQDKAIAGLSPCLVTVYCSIGAWDLARQYAPEAFRKGRNQKRLDLITEQLYKRGMELRQKEQLDDALEYFDTLVQCNAIRLNLNYQRANILFKSGRMKEAVKASHEELKLQPDHRWSKAIIRLVETSPERVWQPHQNRLAEELFRMGVEFLRDVNPVEAVKHFDEVCSDCPRMPNLYYAMATAHAQIGTLYTARQACEIELKLQPEHDGVKKLLTTLNQAINEFEQSDNRVTSR
ncbi:MAG: glycosyltransferase [Planctomycetes bacterium]|nr:glycosyltransferase [Planctomycetota bacterium]